jgi:hypothetical protein
LQRAKAAYSSGLSQASSALSIAASLMAVTKRLGGRVETKQMAVLEKKF